MDKNDLRKKYLEIRKSCEPDIKLINNKLFKSTEFINAEKVFAYVSMKNEISTFEIIRECFRQNKKVAVPKCINDKMEFFYINSFDDLELGTYNILEPTTNLQATNFDNSICITPGIVFDKSGYRIGYGKGFYDKFFKDYVGIKIGLCSKKCIIDTIHPDKFDVPVDYVISD